MAVRNVCFTSFKVDLQPNADNLKALIANPEIAPETGKFHWQGYVELKEPKRYGWIKTNVLGDESAHLEKRMGTREQVCWACWACWVSC